MSTRASILIVLGLAAGAAVLGVGIVSCGAGGATSLSGDAAPDATGDSGVSATRRVSCGTSECSRESDDGNHREVCCVVPGAPPRQSCLPELSRSTDPCPGGGRRECDDRADCGPGNVCCAEQSNNGTVATRCMPTCITGAPRWQVCKTQADCDTGFPCTTDSCPKHGLVGLCGAALPAGCN